MSRAWDICHVTWARAIRGLLCVQALLLATYVTLLVVPAGLVSGFVRDEILSDSCVGVAALAVFLRGVCHPADRGWSWPMAAGIASFTTGDIVYSSYVAHLDPEPFPSIADIGYLGLYPLMALGLLMLVRRGTGTVRRSVLLDGLVACLGAAAVAGTFAAPLVAATGGSGSTLGVLVNAGYPVGDGTLIAMVVGVFVLRGGHPGFYGWIGAGLATFAIGDTLYLYRVATETYSMGSPIDAFWAIGLNIVAYGVWRPRPDPGADRVNSVWTLTAPLISVLLVIGVLVRASLVHTPLPVVLLAAATLLAATGRIVDGFLAVMDIARVRAEARTDELTGLGNRRLLYEAIEAGIPALGPGQAMFLLLVDLDRFKEVNDSLGHAVGDEVLLTIGARLRSKLQPDDVLVRLGGDEFALLLGRRPVDFDVLARTQQVAAEICAPIQLGGLSLQVEPSIGIACAPLDAQDRTDLMRHADIAMYDAKSTHAGAARYDRARDGNALERLQLVAELRQALATDLGQIVVHYQPKCELTGRAVGAEALVRWQHPGRGLVGPDKFLPAAEANSLMPALTRHVLRSALAQCRRWRATDPLVTVSVNLSVTSLLDQNLVDHVSTALAEAGVPPDALVLEITETTIMMDPDRSNRTLRAIRERGIKLSIDDFGTGHCSLAYLRDLPVQELKLDRSFVRDIAARERDAAIVRSTIDLAHSLGLTLVAEGIEDAAGADLLRRMGCDIAQGYYFGRPQPGTDVLADTVDPAAVAAMAPQRA
jgi:diguanylate cyclase (GGDEF)-like protein